VLGYLTPEQEAALQSFWRSLGEIVSSAPLEGSVDVSSATPVAAKVDGPPKGASDADKERIRAEQETANARLALQNYGQIAFMKSFWSLVGADHPDSIVLRFLRARKWNVSAAVAMLASCVKWRIERNVDGLLELGELGLGEKHAGFMSQLELGKCYTQGFDRHGRPVVYINVALHRASEQPQEVRRSTGSSDPKPCAVDGRLYHLYDGDCAVPIGAPSRQGHHLLQHGRLLHEKHG
jgi:hypothetical protein